MSAYFRGILAGLIALMVASVAGAVETPAKENTLPVRQPTGKSIAVSPSTGSSPPGVVKPADVPGRAQAKWPTNAKPLMLDADRRRVVIRAKVCFRDGLLEFLLVSKGTKEHESILQTQAKPSNLHASLLALGLTQGKPARHSRADGRFLPPQGPELDVKFRWKDAKGAMRTADAGDWMETVSVNDKTLPKLWVFVGSNILPNNQYQADATGEIISVANFASAVMDVPFESSEKGALQEYKARTSRIPPLDTVVDVIITPKPGAKASPHARVLLEIDRFGRIRVDSVAMSPAKLRQWAREYVSKHAKASVTVRAEGRAMVCDVQFARAELMFGGVSEIEEERIPATKPVLPRNNAQARRELQRWIARLKDTDEMLVDPAADIKDVLSHIRQELSELAEVRRLLESYRDHLKAAVAERRRSMDNGSNSGSDAGKSSPSNQGKGK